MRKVSLGTAGEQWQKPVGFFECQSDDLVHVEIVVGGEAPDKTGVGFSGRGGPVFFVLGAGVRRRNRIVRLVGCIGGERIFPDDVGVRRYLAGGMFDFDDAGVGVIVGVVDLEGRLPVAGLAADGLTILGGQLFPGITLDFEMKAAVRKVAVAVVEVGVDGAGVDGVPGLVVVPGGVEIGIKLDLKPR